MEWFVYIIECKDGKFYTGITNDLKRRMQQHNRGQGSKFTRVRIPVKLLHNEIFPSREAALKREAEIKGWKKDRKLALLSACMGRFFVSLRGTQGPPFLTSNRLKWWL